MKDIEFDLPPKASPDVIAEWNHLADRVCRELARAGLPAYRGDLDGGPQDGPGAEVHVDPLADGGVYADWRADGELTTAAVELFARGIDHTDPPPIVRHHRDIHQFMQEALLGILASAGLQVEKGDPHLGIAVHVKGLRP
ncbi:hypothetical protein ABZY16_32285 [Streptomyces sp. NPDC006553]|uniref:hypothetical protein n=1 Tax=unclassified Streptomyces TaxID=2593676 RepID=UPI00225983F2|nr:hypothetical protein [Streptomyces sp. NBC_00233]MCX5225928.1 hypothetical protein [Streptomyces sp. NBC_00233]